MASWTRCACLAAILAAVMATNGVFSFPMYQREEERSVGAAEASSLTSRDLRDIQKQLILRRRGNLCDFPNPSICKRIAARARPWPIDQADRRRFIVLDEPWPIDQRDSRRFIVPDEPIEFGKK